MTDFETAFAHKMRRDWGVGEVRGIRKLKGDASYRSYFRVTAGENDKSFILMQWDPALTTRTEEIAKGAAPPEFPFLNVQRYLKGCVRVPEVVAASVPDGLILLEDLGDVTMERALEGAGPGSRRAMYERAVEGLVSIQAAAERNRGADCVAFGRAFDLDLYMWEFNHYVEYGIEARNGRKIPAADRALMDEWFERMSRELDRIPKGFTHRDYQSRNLMLFGDGLYVIDFQDALMGPPQYDLVALLKDSYQSIPEDDARHLASFYLARRADAGLPLDRTEFWRGFKVQTIQRKLKDGARFVFIDRVKKNPSFLPHVPQSFEYVRRYLSEMDDLRELYELLCRYTPELKKA